MGDTEGSRSFRVDGDAYDSFMGRYSTQLAARFADAAGVATGQVVLDVGCGPGALTAELVERLGASSVRACDPSPSFVEACAARFPDVDLRSGRAEQLPLDDDSVDAALAQLVLHFVTEPERAAAEFIRVVRPGGVVGACVWDFADGMEMLRLFWDAALAVDPDAPDEARTLKFGRPGEIADLFEAAGLDGVVESALDVSSTYTGFDELWSGFLHGVGPAGAYCVALPAEQQSQVRQELFERLNSPPGPFTLGAVARCATGTVPN